ncbi:MAG: DUF4446 family protein [Anaerolineae bacterium]
MELNSGFTIVEFLLFVLIGVLVVWIITLEWRLNRYTRTLRLVFSGRTGADLEQILRDYVQRMDRADQNMAALSAHADQGFTALNNRVAVLEQKAPLNVQHIGVIRFNPYTDKGGDQSFAIALLDDRGDGVVVNGLHSRDSCRVYAKPVIGGASTYKMTDEEKEAINRAMTKP